METYKLEVLASAVNDMTEIVASFIMIGSKQGAIRIKNKMNNAIRQIIDFPYSGISVPDSKLSKFGFRMIIAEKYLMFYKVFEGEKKIVLYRVINGKINYPSLLSYLYND